MTINEAKKFFIPGPDFSLTGQGKLAREDAALFRKVKAMLKFQGQDKIKYQSAFEKLSPEDQEDFLLSGGQVRSREQEAEDMAIFVANNPIIPEVKNPFLRGQINLSEQYRLSKEDPVQARKFKAEAQYQ
jgi:hypothetical protein